MIELKKFTAQEELALRRSSAGIYLLSMTELLWKLTSMLENSQDLSDKLKERIESLKGKIENESIELDYASKTYKKLETDVKNFRYQKACEIQLTNILNLNEELMERFKAALNKCISDENFEKMPRLCEIYKKVLQLIGYAKKRVISPKVIMNNLSKLTFDNEILDNLLIQATMAEQEFTSSTIYLKDVLRHDEECDFAVLVQESGGYFMVSYNSDGSVKFKEAVRLIPIKRDYVDGNLEIVGSVIEAADCRYYVSIDDVFDEKNKWEYKFALNWITEKVINEKTGAEYLVIGYYNDHEICLQDGILSIRVSGISPDEERIALNREDSFSLDNDTLINMIEKQLSLFLRQDEAKRMAYFKNE